MYLSLLYRKNEGAKFAFCAVITLLAAPLLVSCTATGPTLVSTGEMTFTRVELMYCTNAGLLLMVTLTPSRLIGRLLPLKSLEPQPRGLLASPEPSIDTKVLPAMPGLKLAPFTTAEITGPPPPP